MDYAAVFIWATSLSATYINLHHARVQAIIESTIAAI